VERCQELVAEGQEYRTKPTGTGVETADYADGADYKTNPNSEKWGEGQGYKTKPN
jgi:hypothetical protein